MTDYTLIHVDLNDPNSYDPVGLPAPGDSVNGNAVTARGTLSVGSVTNFILTNGTVDTGLATNVTVGNPNGVGDPATMNVEGDVNGGATIWSNGHLTADRILGSFSINDGTVTLRLDYDAGAFFSLDGGTLNLLANLNLGAPGTGNSIVFLTDGATLTAGSLTLGSGQSIISMQFDATMVVGGNGALTLDSAIGSQFEIDLGATLDIAGYDVTVRGGSPFESEALRIDRGNVHIRSLDVQANGRVGLIQAGGTLTIAGDLTNIGTVSNFGSELTAKNLTNDATTALVSVQSGGKMTFDGDATNVGTITNSTGEFRATNLTVGDSEAEVDECGDWTYTGLSGTVVYGGYYAIAKTLTLDNQNDSGITLLPGGSLEVGGDHGAVAGRIMVSDGGTIIGHGRIDAETIVVDGTVTANDGVLTVVDAVTGTGKFEIGDSATLHLLQGNNVQVMFQSREHPTFGNESVLWLERPDQIDRTATLVSGLDVGDTIRMGGVPLIINMTGFQVPVVSHATVDSSGLNVAVRETVTGPGPSQTITFNVDAPDGLDFAVRYLPGNRDIAFSVVEDSPQIITGVNGSPTGGANVYIDSLVWGWSKWDLSQGPITYYFADADDVPAAIDLHGDTRLLSCDDPTVIDWRPDQQASFRAATAAYAAIGITFQEVTSVEAANLVLWMLPIHPDDDLANNVVNAGDTEALPYRPDGRLWMFFDNVSTIGDTDKFAPGGEAFTTFVHEMGHALGLAHPHDGGGEHDAVTFPGATSNGVGTDGQNQQVYTVMSYVKGWDGEPNTSRVFGENVGLGALDIAALQELYGRIAANTGSDIYMLPSANGAGTGWQAIWDTSGIDYISNAGSTLAAVIDLREAPLTGPSAGGYVSHAIGIQGGFTIANGVMIENAIGGAGNDTLIGNDFGNRLEGGRGDDTLIGGSGSDLYIWAFGDGNDTIIDDDIGFAGGGTFTPFADPDFAAPDFVQADLAQALVGDADILQLTSLDSAGVTLARVGDDLVITLNGTGETVTVVNQFLGGDTGLEQLQLDDATLDRQAILDIVGGGAPNVSPTVMGPIAAGAAEDSGVVSVDLLAGASDADGDTLNVANVTGLVPGVTLNGNGLQVDTGNAAFQSLAAGVPQNIVVGYDIVDGNGGSVAQTATFTVTGVNDAAQIGGDRSGVVTEDTRSFVTGSLTVSDLDTGQAGFQAGNVAGAYGSLEVDASGAWTYKLNNAAAAVQALDVGETLTDTITVHSVDGTSADIVITVDGKNEGSSPAADLIGLTAMRADPRFAGIDGGGLSVVIIDSGADLDHSAFGPDSDGDGVADRIVFQYDFTGDNDADASDTLGHGTAVAGVVGAQDPGYLGAAPGVNLIILKVGDSVPEPAAVEEAAQWVVANAAAYDVVAVNMSLILENNFNAPLIGILSDEIQDFIDAGIAPVAGTGNEFLFFSTNGQPGVAYPAADPLAWGVGAVHHSDIGAFSFRSGASDNTTAPDRIAAFTQRTTEPGLVDIFAPGAAISSAYLDDGVVTAAGTSLATPYISGIVALAQELALQLSGDLLPVETLHSLIQSTAVPIIDGDDEDDNVVNTGGTFLRVDAFALMEAIYELFPGNTAPIVDAPIVAGAAEDSGVASVDLLAGASDSDGDTLNVANVTGLVPGVTLNGNGLQVDTGNAAFQSLAAGAPQAIVVTYDIVDGNGGSVAQTATFTVTGVNDTAQIGGNQSGAVTEDGTLTASGTLSVADADAGQAGFQAGTFAGAHGSLVLNASGAWTYTLDNADAAVQALNTGDTLPDAFTVHSLDGTTAIIAITINGADEPTGNIITGTDGRNFLRGTASDDVIDARGGNDVVKAKAGDDTVLAGAGRDLVFGQAGDDELHGGAGNDWVFGGDDDDAIFGEDGHDRLFGERGNDVMDGGAGRDLLVGESGNDVLAGGDGRDRIDGGKGLDRIEGGAGDDWLAGGKDADTFVFGPEFGHDVIADFRVKGSAHDVIEFDSDVFADWAELVCAIRDTCEGAVITLDCDNSITLRDVSKAQLIANHADAFVFV